MNEKLIPYFDTLAAAEELKKAGATDKLAKAIVHVIGDSQELLVTKRHLLWMEARLALYVMAANAGVIIFLLNHLG